MPGELPVLGHLPQGQKDSHTRLGHAQVPSCPRTPARDTHTQIRASYTQSLAVAHAAGSGHRPFVKREKG